MLSPEERESAYSDGYAEIPPVLIGGIEVFSAVAHGKGLAELAWRSTFTTVFDAFKRAVEEENVVVGQWLHTYLAIMMMERDELTSDVAIKPEEKSDD